MKKILLFFLTLLTAMTAWASTFTVTNDGNNFIITRNGSGNETVYYRTVNLSAFAGKNYTERTGEIRFGSTQTQATIDVAETPSEIDSYFNDSPLVNNLAYAFQVGCHTRTYRFEVLDSYGNVLAYHDRDIEFPERYQFNDAYLNKSVTDLIYFTDDGEMKSYFANKYVDRTPTNYGGGWIKVTDAGYSQNCWRFKVDLFGAGTWVPSYYAESLGMFVYATVFFTQKEENDGYQYIQIIKQNYNDYDDNDPDGAVNDPEVSMYKACFELSKSGVTTSEHYQFFPHRYDYVNKAAEEEHSISRYEFDYNNSYLWQQKFNSNEERPSTSGSLVFKPYSTNFYVRFDAAGNGDDNWYFKDLKARMALVDTVTPSINEYKVSGGRHSKGNRIYVSVAFNEMVRASSTTQLNTNWGPLNYIEGNGSNVLTFSGFISNNASGTFTVNSYSGYITDWAGNEYYRTINHNFGTTLDVNTYSITYQLNGGSLPSGQSNPTSYTDASPDITLNNPVREGYTFKGWTGNNGTTPEITVTIPTNSIGNRTYIANWEPINYSITYNLNGGSLTAGQSNPTTYNIETPTFTLNNPQKPGYDFKGWSGSNGSTPNATVTIAQGSTGDRNYTANWELPRYSFNSTTGELVLLRGEFNSSNKWGSDVPIDAVTSVTATDEVSFTGVCAELFRYFSNCTSMDLSNVNTSTVTDMAAMFNSCPNLETLNVAGWNTGNVTTTNAMFYGCSSLNSIDVSGWNTGSLSNMSGMFYGCSSLTSLDLSGWTTSNVTTMAALFLNCSNLTTIYVVEDWDTGHLYDSAGMFYGCTSLVGGKGTTYDENHINSVYARIDHGPNNPGYFTDANALPRYTFDSATGALSLNWGEFNKDAKWGDDVPPLSVISVTATDEVSFTGDCTQLFYGFENCTSMDLNSVNTSEVTSMRNMFTGCVSLTSLDLSNWDTGNVTDMYCMFLQCNHLDSLNLSNFNTANVTNMALMFDGCKKLKSLNVSGWDTGNVTEMYNLFCSCSSLKTLDLSGWSAGNATQLMSMFALCDSLTTIYADRDWNIWSNANSSGMFGSCTSLVGGMGTIFTWDHVGAEYARIDGGPDSPGYFTDPNAVVVVTGDVDGDGYVTTVDITCIYNYLLNGDTTFLATSDVDGDGYVTTTDITVIYNILLGSKK
ncbi:MAG: BspA family leucine-rich repeat surface protein [Muribaculaceae bacterium]|nr:BspA family leucine-rich repeat surface protein [Muribaculaceae bacterium]